MKKEDKICFGSKMKEIPIPSSYGLSAPFLTAYTSQIQLSSIDLLLDIFILGKTGMSKLYASLIFLQIWSVHFSSYIIFID